MKTLAKDVYKVIRHRVVTGELQPGGRVAELALAKELGISRAPVHEAIGKLAVEGLLERVPNVGAFVRIPDLDELRQNFELRAWIESKAAAKAATQMTLSDLAQLQRYCDDMRHLADHQEKAGVELMVEEYGQEFSSDDLSFHLLLVKASGNEKALSFLTNQHLLSRLWSSINMPHYQHEASRISNEHDQIFAAIQARDSEMAESLMEKHIQTGMGVMLQYFESTGRFKKDGYGLTSNRKALEEQLRMIEEAEMPRRAHGA